MSDYTLFFCSSSDMHRYAKELPSPKIGCTTAGEIDNGLMNGLAKVTFPSEHFNVDVVKVDDVRVPVLKASEIKEKAAQVKSGKKNLLCFVLNDGLSAREEVMQTTLEAILPKGTQIVGGSSGDGANFKNTYCCVDAEVFAGSVVILIGTNLDYYIHKENIYVPTDKSMIVTKAEGRRLYELDGMRASKRYADLLGVAEKDLDKYLFENPLGKIDGAEVYVSSPQKSNPDGSVDFYCKILPSSFLKLLHTADVETKLKETTAAITSKGNVLFTLVSNCMSRTVKFQDDNIVGMVNGYFRKFKGIGWTAYGEQLNGLHVNQTMITLTFYERRN